MRKKTAKHYLFSGLKISINLKYFINLVFKIVGTFFIFKVISSLINEESTLFKKLFKDANNKAVNGFICKIARVFLWMIYFTIVINEIGYDLSGFSALVTGLGIGSAAIALAATFAAATTALAVALAACAATLAALAAA